MSKFSNVYNPIYIVIRVISHSFTPCVYSDKVGSHSTPPTGDLTAVEMISILNKAGNLYNW